MPGTLKIHSTGPGELLLDHSWIEYCPYDGEPRTFGTWGNNPSGHGNGLFENLELGQAGDVCRVRQIDALQERLLFEKIDEYRNRGENAWSLSSPCSTFAADTWAHVTGERLAYKTAGISNPSRLTKSIGEHNRRDARNVLAQPNVRTPDSNESPTEHDQDDPHARTQMPRKRSMRRR